MRRHEEAEGSTRGLGWPFRIAASVALIGIPLGILAVQSLRNTSNEDLSHPQKRFPNPRLEERVAAPGARDERSIDSDDLAREKFRAGTYTNNVRVRNEMKREQFERINTQLSTPPFDSEDACDS